MPKSSRTPKPPTSSTLALPLLPLARTVKRASMGRGGRTDPVMALNTASVKRELDLTDEQSAKIPEAVMKALAEVLNEKQFSRLKQIELQQRSTRAFSDPNVQDALILNGDQRGS